MCSLFCLLFSIFIFIIVVILYKRLLFKKNKFYVVIDWGEKIGYEYLSAVGWEKSGNLLTLNKLDGEELIVLNKTQKVVVFKMNSSEFDKTIKIDVFNPVFLYTVEKNK